MAPGLRGTARHRRDLLAAGLGEVGYDNGLRAAVLASLPERFDDEDFERALARIPAERLADGAARETVEQLRDAIGASYTVSFPAEVGLDQRVLWPATPSERNGMEDARFVRFSGDDGTAVYLATYTAYDGRHISARLLRSHDLLHYDIAPLGGPAVRSKGMALFPRTVHGRHLALSRSDGETIGLTARDENHQWQTPVPLHPPSLSWGLVQVGNCGSPLETKAGWLVLTHGVGPMRRYAIGAMLLDLHRPEQVIAILPGTLLAPDENDRDGYVPNVVYSCGALLHHGTLWVPYGASDTRVGFAYIALDTVMSALRAT
ncbi:glycoside hydrolase family 130 protein [Rugosimonospora acidiphila]|uniref:glycoside hydrolase family 130 protein n=1 Tax=Rugosimonospora acidiphila TaxID=556531 RepID=UPI0031E92D66